MCSHSADVVITSNYEKQDHFKLMMKSYLAAIFFVTCFLCCVVLATSFGAIPRLDQVEILLAFKNEFPNRNCDPSWNTPSTERRSPSDSLRSWTKDSDYFDGINVDIETGVVISIDLSFECISGTIHANSSLFKLQHLSYLDLSSNHFDSSPFPAEFGRLANLEFLDLSENGFIGEVPSSFSNLSRLTKLSLSYNKLTGQFPLVQNLTFLYHLDLSYNHFCDTVPSSLFTMPSLQHIDLRNNHLTDPLENMSYSTTSNLEYLDMAENLFSCRVLEPISKLANLTHLDLSFQNRTSTFNFEFLPLKSLEYLDLSGNSISRLDTGSTELMKHLALSSCNITEFPTFIKSLRNLEELDLSKNRLKGKVPEWLWDLPSLHNVNISHNSINILEGSSTVILNSSLVKLDLSSNTFYGPFPIIPPTIEVMAASDNNFSGGIPLTFCNASQLELLDLSNNNFGGSIPRCLIKASIAALKLSNNNLTGRLPNMNDSLVLLDVGHNQISGNLPRSLYNCIDLTILNVESNRITDTFPFWLKPMPYLEVLVLRSNRFHGPISSPLNPLPFWALRIIDISLNKFNGSLPPNYFVNWSLPLVDIISPDYSWPGYTGDFHSLRPTPQWYYPSIYMRNKGLNTKFEKILETYAAIDFSGNRLEGQIPESIGLMKSLIMLDLSNNSFTGHIPSSMANLKQLESLDLSQNQLSGKIPQELRALTFLAYVNMSHNKLIGQIPQGAQIGGQPKSCFEGNIDLCGLPLEESCFKENGAASTPQTQEGVLNWKAVVIGYGPGVLFGVAITQAVATYKPVLFCKLFRL